MPNEILKDHQLALQLAIASGNPDDVKQALLDMRAYKLAKLEVGLRAVESLITESDGVCGLHLNGDNAYWDELQDTWLSEFYDAIELLNLGD